MKTAIYSPPFTHAQSLNYSRHPQARVTVKEEVIKTEISIVIDDEVILKDKCTSGNLVELKMSFFIYCQTSAMRIPAERNLTHIQKKMTKYMQFRIFSLSVNRLTGFRDLCWQRSETGRSPSQDIGHGQKSQKKRSPKTVKWSSTNNKVTQAGKNTKGRMMNLCKEIGAHGVKYIL